MKMETPLPILVVAKRYASIERGAGKVVELGLFIIQERSQEDYICFLSILKIVKTT